MPERFIAVFYTGLGAALLLAAMQAEGESTIFGVKHIKRGYDTLETALQSAGARLKTVEIPKKM